MEMAKMMVVDEKIYHGGTLVLRENGKPLNINQATMMLWPRFCATWPADKALIPGILRLVRERAVRVAHEERQLDDGAVGRGMHTAKCEICEVEVEFRTYRHGWPVGWTLTGLSRWGKKYHRKSGWGWWCPKCQAFAGQESRLRNWLMMLSLPLRDGILAHLPGLREINA